VLLETWDRVGMSRERMARCIGSRENDLSVTVLAGSGLLELWLCGHSYSLSL